MFECGCRLRKEEDVGNVRVVCGCEVRGRRRAWERLKLCEGSTWD